MIQTTKSDRIKDRSEKRKILDMFKSILERYVLSVYYFTALAIFGFLIYLIFALRTPIQ